MIFETLRMIQVEIIVGAAPDIQTFAPWAKPNSTSREPSEA